MQLGDGDDASDAERSVSVGVAHGVDDVLEHHQQGVRGGRLAHQVLYSSTENT